MALDYLTIQPMSAECERLFSSAKQMVTDLRKNLDTQMISICQCLRSWYRSGLIDDLDLELLDFSDVEPLQVVKGTVLEREPEWLKEPTEEYEDDRSLDIVADVGTPMLID